MEKIGKYRIEGLIGKGGFGRVYRAFDSTVDRTVAIKILHAEGQLDEDQLLTRFRAEAKTTGTLFHKNIVTVYEYGEQDGLPYLVMEYLQGRNLEQIIQKHEPPLSLIEKVSLMKQVGEGLQYAHGKGIIHRDVKPANIMVSSDGAVKLMDFGIARLAQDAPSRMTQQGQFMGTFAYMAPEQFEGRDVDCLTDIFAYGVVYYHLLTGCHPFQGPGSKHKSVAVLVRNVTTLDPSPIREWVPECPAALEQIIFKAIHKDRQQRYQSFDDLQLDVAPILLQLEGELANQKVEEGERCFASGRVEEARSIAREALRLAPGSQAADALRRKIQQEIHIRAQRERCVPILNRGREELAAGNYAKAVEMYATVLRIDPLDTEAARSMESAKTALDHIERANLLLEQARRELAADNLTNAGLIADQFFEEALDLLAELNIAYPAADKVQELMIATLKAQEARDRRELLKKELEHADHQIQGLQWKAAVDNLQGLATRYPDNAQVQSRLSEARNGLQAKNRAVDIARIEKEVRSSIEKQQFDQAADLVARGLQTYPDDPTLLRSQSDLLRARHQHERWLAIEKASKRALELSAGKRFAEAAVELERAIRTWDAQELNEQRQRIEVERQAYEREKEFADSVASIQGLRAAGKLELALNLARQVAKDFPDRPDAMSIALQIESKVVERKRHDRLNALQKEADELISRSDFNRAFDLLENAAREFPDEPYFADRILQINSTVLARISQFRLEQQFTKAIDLLSVLIKKRAHDGSLVKLESEIRQQWKQKARTDAVARALSQSAEEANRGDLEAAISILEKANREYPGDDGIQSSLERLKAQRADQIRDAEVRAIAERATALLQKRDYANTSVVLRNGLEQFPGDPRLTDVFKRAESAKFEDERRAAIQGALAGANQLQSRGQLREAAQTLEHVLGRFPSTPELAARLHLLRRLIADAEEVERAVDQATSLRNERKLSEAIAVIKGALQKFPQTPKLTALLIDVSNQHQLAEIKALVERIERKRSAGGLSEALRDLESGLASFPNDPGLLKLKPAIQADLKERSRRNEIERIAFEARKLIDAKNLTAALTMLREALGQFPEETELTRLLSLAKEFEAVRLDSVNRWAKQAEEMLDHGQLMDATQILQKGLIDFPGEKTLLGSLDRVETEAARLRREDAIQSKVDEANALAAEKHCKEAIKLLNQALEEYPQEPKLLDQRQTVERLLQKEESLEAQRKREKLKKKWQETRTLRLAFGIAVVVSAVILVAVSNFFFFRTDSPEVAPVAFRIRTDPPGATLRIMDHSCSDMECSFDLRPGSYEVQATLSGYRPLNRMITVGTNPSQVALTLNPFRTALNISTNFERGTVLLDGKEVGSLSQGGFDIGEVPDGSHVVEVKGPVGTARIEFAGRSGTLPSLLRPIEAGNLQSLVVATLSRQAALISDGKVRTVLLSNNPIGEVGPSVLSTQLPADGPQQFALREANRSLEFPVVSGDIPTLSIGLRGANSNTGTLVVMTGQEGVDVFINDQNSKRTGPNGNSTLSLPPSTYVVRIVKEGYTAAPAEGRIALNRDEHKSLVFTLTPRLADIEKKLADTDWEKTSKDDLVQLNEFRQKHPGSVHDAEARNLIARITAADEDRRLVESDWERTPKDDLVQLNGYRQRHPGSVHDAEARNLIARITAADEDRRLVESDWERTPKDDLVQLNGYRQRHPGSVHDTEARNLIARLQQLEKDQRDIGLLFEALVSAFNRKDVTETKRLWPTVENSVSGLLAIRDSRYEMTLEPIGKAKVVPAAPTGESTATALYRQMLVSSPVKPTSNPDDRPRTSNRNFEFQLRRTGGQWGIVSHRVF